MDNEKFQELIIEQFGIMNKRFESIDQKFGQIDQKFGQIDQRFSKIDDTLIRMENKMDEKFSALFEARNIQNNINSVILGKLINIETKVENLELKSKSHDAEFVAITKRKFCLVEAPE